MKYVTIIIWEADKAAALSKVLDQLATDPPQGYRLLTDYVCLGQPASGFPVGAAVTILTSEAESAEAIASANYPLMLAGGAINTVPVLDIPLAETVAVEKKYRS